MESYCYVLVILLCFCVAFDHVTCTLNTLTTTEKPPAVVVVENAAIMKAARLNYGGVVPVEISRDLPSKINLIVFYNFFANNYTSSIWVGAFFWSYTKSKGGPKHIDSCMLRYFFRHSDYFNIPSQCCMSCTSRSGLELSLKGIFILIFIPPFSKMRFCANCKS